MRKQSSDSKERQPGVFSLVVFAAFILAAWQASSFIFATNGPMHAVLYWLLTFTSAVRTLPNELLVGLAACLGLPSLFALLFSRARNRRVWHKLLRDLPSQGSKRGMTLEAVSIQGIDLVSLPFAPEQVLPNVMRRGFDWTNSYSPHKYAHWVALHNELREFMFELDIGPSISIRFWVPHTRQSDDELGILRSSLQTSYGSIELAETSPAEIPAILGTPKQSPVFRREIAGFGNEFVSIIEMEGIPGTNSEGTQLDKLIHALTELEIRASFVVHCSRTGNRFPGLFGRGKQPEINTGPSRAFPVSPQRFEQDMIDEKALGSWRVSAYMVVRTRDSESHLAKVKSARIVLETTFLNPTQPMRTAILTGRALRKAMLKTLRRDAVGRTRVLSSREVSLLVHLPQQAQPGVYRNMRLSSKFLQKAASSGRCASGWTRLTYLIQ